MSRKSVISPYFLAILLVAWILLTLNVGVAWFGHQDNNGAWISLAVRNYQWHGFLQLGGLPDINTDPNGAPEPYTHHPPLVVWLESPLVFLAGYNESLIRFIAASCTLISASALYVLTRRLAGVRFALWSTASYLFTPMMAYFGRMPDHEAPALMFSLLFAAVLVNWLRRPARRQWWALVVLTILTAWTAWGGLIVIGALSVIGLFFTRRRDALIMLGVIAVASIVIMLGYYEIFFQDAIPDLIRAFMWRASSNSLDPGTVDFTIGQYAARFAVRLITLIGPTLCVLIAVGVGVMFRQRGLLRGIIIGLVAAGIGYIFLFRNASYIHDYYLLYLTPALALLAGAGVALLPRRAPRWLRPLVVALVVMVLPATIFYLNEIYTSTDSLVPLDYARIVQQNTTVDDLIVSNLPDIGEALEFYAERTVLWNVPPASALQQMNDFGGTTYYLHCDRHSVLPEDAPHLQQMELSSGCYLTRLH